MNAPFVLSVLQSKLPFSFFHVLLLSLLVRMSSYFVLMADPDEWSYIISASELLNGEVLYRDVIDIKPPGIFLIFMAMIKAVGLNMLAYRLLGAFILASAAWSAGVIAGRLWSDIRVQWPASILYLSAFITPMGNALNTELFYVSFSLIALLLLSRALFVPAGVFMGMAFVVKYTIPAELLMAAMLITLPHMKGSKSLRFDRTFISSLAKFSAGFVVIVLLTALWMHRSNALQAFATMMSNLPGSYASTGSNRARLDLFALYHFRFIWIAIPAYLALKKLFRHSPFVGYSILSAMILVWISVLISGKLHDHYWLQLAPIYSILAAGICTRLPVLPVMSLLLLGANAFSLSILPANARLKSEAAVIKDQLPSDAAVWVAGLPSVYYFLLDSDCPTPYVHGSLLTAEKHLKGFQINRQREWDKAMQSSDALLLKKVEATPSEEIYELAIERYNRHFPINGETTLFLKP